MKLICRRVWRIPSSGCTLTDFSQTKSLSCHVEGFWQIVGRTECLRSNNDWLKFDKEDSTKRSGNQIDSSYILVWFFFSAVVHFGMMLQEGHTVYKVWNKSEINLAISVFFHLNLNVSLSKYFWNNSCEVLFHCPYVSATFVDWLNSLLVVIDVLTERGRRGRRKQTRYFVTSSQPFCIVCALMRHSRKALKRLWHKWEIPPKNGKANRGLLPQGVTCYTIPFSIQRWYFLLSQTIQICPGLAVMLTEMEARLCSGFNASSQCGSHIFQIHQQSR